MNSSKSIRGIAQIITIVNIFHFFDAQTSVTGDIKSISGQLVSSVVPLDEGFRGSKSFARESDLTSGYGPHHWLRGRSYFRGKGKNIDEDILVDVTIHSF